MTIKFKDNTIREIHKDEEFVITRDGITIGTNSPYLGLIYAWEDISIIYGNKTDKMHGVMIANKDNSFDTFSEHFPDEECDV